MAVKDVSFFKGGQDYTNPEARRRDALAELLARQAQPEETQMVSGIAVPQSPLAGLAKALTMGLSGYQAGAAGREEEAAKKRAQQTMADAVGAYGRSQAGGTTDIGGGESVNWNKATPDQSGQLYSNILMGNEDTAGLGMQSQMQQIQGQQTAARELDAFKQKMPFELQLAREKAAATRDPTGGDTGALLDRLVKVGQEGNPSYNLISALQDLKGGAGQSGRNAADIATGAAANFQNQEGKNQSDIGAAAPKAQNESLGKGAGNTIIDNNKTLGNLNNMRFSIQGARQLLPTVSATGPVMGRVGNAAEDPDYKNLQGSINAITLQAKDLYNLGSGNGFTDADRDFLREVIAGKYARAETIGMGLDRMDEALKHREEYLQGQNSQYQQGNYFGQGGANPGMNLPVPGLGGTTGAQVPGVSPEQLGLSPQEQQRLQELRAKHKR